MRRFNDVESEAVADIGDARPGLLKVMLGFVSPRQWEVIAGLAAPVLLLGALACGEGLLRFQQYRAFGGAQAVETEVDEGVWEAVGDRRRPRANAAMGAIKFNALGFRSATLVVPKPAGVVRIGFFGSSTTMDLYVESERETWPAIATDELRRAYPRCRIDYFNAGVVGYDVRASQARLFEDAGEAKPDIVVFLFNDVSGRARRQLEAKGVEAKPYEPSWFATQSLLWQKLEKNETAEALKRLAARKDKANRLDLDALIAPLMQELDSLTKQVEAHGMLPVFVASAPRIRRSQSLTTQADNAISRVLYMPKVFIGDITESFYRYNDALKQTAAAHRVPYVETIEQMPDGASFYVDSSHTTVEGSRIFGRIVGKALGVDVQIRELLHQRGQGCT